MRDKGIKWAGYEEGRVSKKFKVKCAEEGREEHKPKERGSR